MFKNKIVTAGMAGMLAMSLGLAACGNNKTATENTSSNAESTEAVTETLDEVVYWEGTLADSSTVSYMDDVASGSATLYIIKEDLSDAKAWSGPVTSTGDTVTIKDSESGESITFTLSDLKPGSSVKVNIDGYGEAELTAVTESDFEELGAEISSILSGIANTNVDAVIYWEGKLDNATTISYMDDEASGSATVTIVKDDLSDAKMWSGTKVSTDDGKVTVLDDESGSSIVLTISDLKPGKSAKVTVEGYGEAELEAVTESQFQKQLTDALDYLGKALTGDAE